MKKYEHDKAFYDKAYNVYKNNVLNRGGHPLNRVSFEGAWEDAKAAGSKNIQRTLLYDTLYSTSYKTARAELNVLRARGDKKTKLKDLQTMTTQDFAAHHKADIVATYDAAIANGADKATARAIVSSFWFGSK